jgi:hypothetical protein
MREMYFGAAPDFDTVMNDIRELETTINAGQLQIATSCDCDAAVSEA